VLKDFSEQWTQEGVFVMDASFYTQPNLQQVGSLGWLSRVPLTLKAAQALVQSEVSLLSEVPCDSLDYRMWEVEPTYGEVAQRWVLIESQHRKANDALWRLEVEKLESWLNGQLKVLTQKVFACKPNALDAVMAF
jgi:transposase